MIERKCRRPPAVVVVSGAIFVVFASVKVAEAGRGEHDLRFYHQIVPKAEQKVAPAAPAPAVVAPKNKKKEDRKTELDDEFFEGYKRAYVLAHAGAYEAAFIAFKALNHDDHPDVANHLGFISRKLGRYDESKVWYERALASDPNHTRTWQYYGLWHLEQGNRLKAEDNLEKIRLICGLGCEDYQSLREAIDLGRGSY